MRRFISVLLLSLLCISSTVYAAKPLKSYMELKDGRHVYIKTFEASPDEDPSLLKEKPFEQDGFSYTYYETAKEEIPFVEKREETQTATVTTADNSVQAILQQFEPDMDYEGEDGFIGKLLLDHASVKTEVEGYKNQTFTVKDTMTIMGLSNNDPSNIPKTTVKDGVTLNLQNVDWSAQESAAVDFETVTTKYKAVAYYSGSYSKKVPTGYISTVEYKGEVTKTRIEKVIYTLTYIGTELPKPTPEPTPEPTSGPEVPQEKESSFKWLIVGIAICLAIIGGAVAAFFIFFYNTFIYLKNADEYRLIAKRRIKWNNPVVDLNGLDVSGKEVAVNVKRIIAGKLFGRHIKTVADEGFSIRCLVDKQNCDFWYVVNVPGASADTAETSE